MSKTPPRPRVVLVNRCLVMDVDGKLLMIQRATNDSYQAGLWEAPGGKLDEGQDLTHSLEREVIEETGILISPEQRLVYADSQIVAAGKYRGMPYIVLFSVAKMLGGTLKLSEEHDDARWLSAEAALKLDLRPETKKALILYQQILSKA